MKISNIKKVGKVILVALPIITLFTALAVYDHLRFVGKIVTPGIERKVYNLVTQDAHNTKIIIGGDSRAERQIDPQIITQTTGLEARNVGISSGDTYTLLYYLNKYDVLSDSKILILSLSYPFGNCQQLHGVQVNNTYRDLTKKIIDYKILGLEITKNYFKKTSVQYDQNGFLGIEGDIVLPITISTDPATTNHPFYKKINYNCSRWDDTRNMLLEVSKTNSIIVIYQPPISPSWRKYIHGTFIEESELTYSKMLTEEIKKYDNVYFLDYFTNDTPQLTDSMYYDIQHLNRSGASIFTKILLQDLEDISVLSNKKH